MTPSPVKRYRQKSRLLGGERGAKLREQALDLAQKGLANRRGGPVDHGSPQAQQHAAQQMQGAKKKQRDQQLRSGVFRRQAPAAPAKGSLPMLRRPSAARETGPTAGTYNRGLKPSGGSAQQGQLEQLARQRATQDRPKAKRKLFARA